MSRESLEILLSAYLDDELSSEERAEVEARLASDASYRLLHDELLATRAAMQSLPRHRLDHDLSAAVLRRSERAVLDGGPDRAPVSVLRTWWTQGRSWRMLAWPAAAIAAALVIALFSTEQPAERKVAMEAPRGPISISAPHAATAVDESAPAAAAPAAVESVVSDQPGSPVGGEGLSRSSAGRRQMSDAPAQRYAAPRDAEGKVVAGAGELVVLDVNQQFVESRALEHWLDEHKIAWKPASKSESPRDDFRATPQVAAKTSGAVQDYETHLTADELAMLRTEVGRLLATVTRKEALNKLSEDRAAVVPKPAAPAESSHERRPIVLRLRVVVPPSAEADRIETKTDP